MRQFWRLQLWQTPTALTVGEKAKLAQADRAAARFVERFCKTRDFGTVWREFRVKDIWCAVRLWHGLESFSSADLEEKSFEQRLQEKEFDDRLLERLHEVSDGKLLIANVSLTTVSRALARFTFLKSGSLCSSFPRRTER